MDSSHGLVISIPLVHSVELIDWILIELRYHINPYWRLQYPIGVVNIAFFYTYKTYMDTSIVILTSEHFEWRINDYVCAYQLIVIILMGL